MQDTTQNTSTETQGSTCICPLITEPEVDLSLQYCRPGDAGRTRLMHMIQQLFEAAYSADVKDYCDDLIGLHEGRQLLGVAGLRPANNSSALFSEQYLDVPADHLISSHTGKDVDRTRLIEIGNLAVTGTGNTRWLFAVMTAFLHAAGYRWVICTAISPLISMFKRIGLDPVVLDDADPARLTGNAESWGCYYDLKPKVCFGSIDAGYEKVNSVITSRHPRLQALWNEAHVAGIAYANQSRINRTVVSL